MEGGGGRGARERLFFKAKGKEGGDSGKVMKESGGVTNQRGAAGSSAKFTVAINQMHSEILPRSVSLVWSFDDKGKVRGGKNV